MEQYHCRLRQYHADEVSISLKTFFDSEVFQNFIDAFRAFSVCSRIRTGETVEMFTNLWYNKAKKGDDLYEII